MNNIKQYIPLLKLMQEIDGPVGATFLSTKTNLSQATVGRYLLQLEQKGLVKKVSNKGRTLTSKGIETINELNISFNKDKIAKELISLSIDDRKETLLEIIAVRKLLEQYTAAKAAENATPHDIQVLEDYAYTHRYLLSQGNCANAEDLGFHLTIAKISQNQTLYKILELLLKDNNAYVMFSEAGDDQRDLQVTYHFRILDAIRNKNPLEAQKAITEHLEQVSNDVEKYYQRT